MLSLPTMRRSSEAMRDAMMALVVGSVTTVLWRMSCE